MVLPLIIRVVKGPSSQTPSTAAVGADNLDVWLIRFCPFVGMLSYVYKSFARTTNQYYASGALAAVAGFGTPTLHSALTKHVAKDEVGRLLGALSLLGSLSRVVGPIVLNLLYSFTVGSCPQMVFYVLSGAMFVAFCMSLGIRAHGEIYFDSLLTLSEGGCGEFCGRRWTRLSVLGYEILSTVGNGRAYFV